MVRLDPAFEVLTRADLFAVTLLALVSPVLCFVIDLYRQPARLWSFLAKSTARYGALGRVGSELRKFTDRSHPDHPLVQTLELVCGATLVVLARASVRLPFLGLALGYFMPPLLHYCTWNACAVRAIVQLPFVLIVTGVMLGSLSLVGVQTVFFGYRFHF